MESVPKVKTFKALFEESTTIKVVYGSPFLEVLNFSDCILPFYMNHFPIILVWITNNFGNRGFDSLCIYYLGNEAKAYKGKYDGQCNFIASDCSHFPPPSKLFFVHAIDQHPEHLAYVNLEFCHSLFLNPGDLPAIVVSLKYFISIITQHTNDNPSRKHSNKKKNCPFYSFFIFCFHYLFLFSIQVKINIYLPIFV